MSGHRPSRYSNPVGIAGSSFKDFSKLARAIREQTTAPGLFSLISCGKSIGGKGFLLEAKDPQAAASIVKAWEKLKEAQGGDAKAGAGQTPPQWGVAEQWGNNARPLRGVRLLAKGVDPGVTEHDFISAVPRANGYYRHVDKKGQDTTFVFFNVPTQEEAVAIVESGIQLPELLINVRDVTFASERQLVGFCYNCLRVGCHSSRCKQIVCCAYCKGSHFRKDCPLKNDPAIVNNRKCINCGSSEHWGDDRKSCPKLKSKPTNSDANKANHSSYAQAAAARNNKALSDTKAAMENRMRGIEGRLTVIEKSNKVNTDKLQELRVAAMEHTIALGSHLHKFQNPGWQMPAACADACFSITEKAANMLAAIDKNQMFTPAQLAKQTKRSREEK
jgi:hypothetical protein